MISLEVEIPIAMDRVVCKCQVPYLWTRDVDVLFPRLICSARAGPGNEELGGLQG